MVRWFGTDRGEGMGRTPPGQTRERVFRLVRERLLAGAPPTVREVQRAFGFRSVQTAREHLEALVREGRLAKRKGQSRGYRLPSGEGPPTVLVPLLGRVPAGSLDLAVEELEGYLPMQSRRPAGELFALRVRGESMTGAGILPGDVVVVRRQRTARSGEIVVALVGDEATVKRLRVRGKRVELRPANPDYEPIVADPRELTLLGKVVEVRRSLEGR
jgi:repressor LexA